MSTDKFTQQEYLDCFSAQTGVFARAQQLRLRRATVHVAGLGGVGFHVAMFLSELGIGSITANDPQKLEIDNLNRIPFASAADVGVPKARLLERQLRHRPHNKIVGLVYGSEDYRVGAYLRKADCIVCCSNTYASRRTCTTAAIKYGTPLVDVGVADARHRLAGGIRLFKCADGAKGACPLCSVSQHSFPAVTDQLLGPMTAITAGLAAYLAALTVLRLLGKEAPNYVQIDLQTLRIQQFRIRPNQRCSLCARAREIWRAKDRTTRPGRVI